LGGTFIFPDRRVVFVKPFRTAILSLFMLSAASLAGHAATISVMIGDDDGFGGTQGASSSPGDPYVNFPAPTIAPGIYMKAAGTDASTVPPYEPYTFIFAFVWDASTLTSISSATITVQSGSLARRIDGSGALVPGASGTGFGVADVTADAGGGAVALGDFLTVGTGANGTPLEESVKHSVFDVTALIGAGTTGVLALTIDGSTSTGAGDLFALDYALLTITGDTALPAPGGLAVLAAGLLLLGRRRNT
jgi:hypothetical protein